MACHTVGDVLDRIREVMVGVFDISDLQERVLDLCQELFQAEACSLFLFDEARESLRIAAARGYADKFLDRPPLLESRSEVVEQPSSDEEKLGVTAWIGLTGQPFMANSAQELQAHPHWKGKHDWEQFGAGKQVTNFYGVPLIATVGEVVGVLKVEGKRDPDGEYCPFTDEDADIFDILAAYVAVSLVNAQHVTRIQRQSEQLQTIADALQRVIGVLSEERPMQELLNEIIATTKEILSAEACVLFLKDEKRNILTERAGVGYVEHLIGKAEYRLVDPKDLVEQPESPEDKVGLTAWIAITGQPFLARNHTELRAHPHWRGRYDSEHYPDGSGKQCNSFLGVPLLVADEAVGVLKVENKRVDGEYVPFTEQDRQVFETLARSIAIAIGKVQEQRVKREQAITDAMYRVSAALAGRFELEPLLADLVEVGKEIFDAEACVVFLVDQTDPTRLIETKGEGYVAHLEGIAEYQLVPKEKLIDRPERREDKVGLTAWIAITGQPFLARDNDELRAHPHWRGRYDDEHYPDGSGKRCNSFLGLPLRVGDEILGVLKVENKQVGGEYVPFDERDQHIFQLLANSAAIAIRNTRDFQELQESQELASIGRSAAAMAHRMRTPLQNMRTTAELLQEELKENDAATDRNLTDIEDILEAVEQMDDAIERVRGAARQHKLVLQEHDVGDIIRDSFVDKRSFAQQISDRQIEARIVGLDDLADRKVWWDKNLIEETISNLVGNALEAVANEGLVEIKVAEVNGIVRIEVRDDGPGVNENEVNLFEPFSTDKKGGLGLGLYIVRRNVEVHGGTASYIKREGGACFRIDLPRHGQEEQENA